MFLKTPKEMLNIQVSQIGQSACGPTAVLNILASLDYSPLPKPEELLKMFPARLRDYETKSLSKYLYSRAVAGTIHDEILDATVKISNNTITGKFFIIKQYEDKNKFAKWLEECFKNKIALVFLENLFIEGNDAWHHQMAYGIDNDKIFLTNPMNIVPVSQMISYLTTGSWMIIPGQHVIERDIEKEDIEELSKDKWDCFNVLERAKSIKILKKFTIFNQLAYSDLTIPYGGIAGVTAFCRNDNIDGINFLKKYTQNEEEIFLPIYEKNIKANRLNL